MLFQSQVDQTLSKMFDTTVLTSSSTRKTEAAKRLDFYHDQQIDYINDRLTAYFSDPDRLTPAFFNVVKKIINQLAAVYAKDPVREITGGENEKQDIAIFQEIVESSRLSVKMKIASRYAELLKTVLLRPVWRKGRMDLDILTPDQLDVSYGDTPEDLTAVIITHFPESGKYDEVEYSLWNAEEWRRLNWQGHTIDSGSNPYGILPFVPVWDRYPIADFWQEGGDDLINVQECINEKLTDLIYCIRQQGFGVGWIRKGAKGGGLLQVDPGNLVELPENGALGFESQKAPIKEIVGAIEFLITQAGIMNGLSSSSLSTTTTRESGLAKVQSARELEEQRRDDIVLWSEYEKRLFDIFATVWNTHNPQRMFSDNSRLRINFADPKPVLTPKEQAETDRMLMDLGLKSPVDCILEQDPDIQTREQAMERLQQIKTENDQFRPMPADPAKSLTMEKTGD